MSFYTGIMWPGEAEDDGPIYRWEAKVYERPSIWGINNSRISKLGISTEDGRELYRYDRGWSSEPAEGWMIDVLLNMFPGQL